VTMLLKLGDDEEGDGAGVLREGLAALETPS
jgi:hypothetical protein